MRLKTKNKFESHLLSIRDERQNMIHSNSHPTYNERQQKIIEIIDSVIGENIRQQRIYKR